MKNRIKNFLQKTLGYDNYLFYFSKFTIAKVKMNSYEKEFNYDNGKLTDSTNQLVTNFLFVQN